MTNTIEFTAGSPINISAIFNRQYLVQLAPQNSNGQNLTSVAYYNISGQTIDSNSTFLFTNKNYNIQYIHYKGVNISTNHEFTVDSPMLLEFRTPVYNIVVDTQSVFGTPVNASVNLTFKNNTHVTLHSGNNGTTSFENVPYGYVSGYADYFGIKENVNLQNGDSAYLTFLTGSLILYATIGILFIVAVAWLVEHYEKRRKPQGRRS